jgi:hypothetical protein
MLGIKDYEARDTCHDCGGQSKMAETNKRHQERLRKKLADDAMPRLKAAQK